jgi:hypothetical protein
MIHLPQASDGRSGDLMRQKAAQLLGAGFISPFVFPEEQSHPWSVNESTVHLCDFGT